MTATTRTVFGLGTFALLLAGCEASPRGSTADTRGPDVLAVRAQPESPALSPTQQESAKPDVSRLGYDAARRTLRVYELPEKAARWLLALPGSPMGVPVDGEYEFPANVECDLDQVVLFYTLPNHRPSPGVSLREIAETTSR